MTDPCPRCGRPASSTSPGDETTELRCDACGHDVPFANRSPVDGSVLFWQTLRFPFTWSRPLSTSERTQREVRRLDERIEANRRRGQRVSRELVAYRNELAERAEREREVENTEAPISPG